jgi:hypothetical protein
MGVVEEKTASEKRNPEMDLELSEIRARMEQLTLKMQRDAKDIGCMSGPSRRR